MDYMSTSFGMEAIAYQNRTNIFDEVCKRFRTAMETESRNLSRTVQDLGIEKYIFDQFGVLFTLRVERSDSPNAYVIPPDMKINHVLLNDYRNQYAKGESALAYLKGSKLKTIRGWVDRSSGRIGGAFSKMDSEVVMASALFSGDFTPEEVAAIFFHELGHVWSYFECLGLTMSANFALEAVSHAMTGKTDTKLNFELITALEVSTGTKMPDSRNIANMKSTEEMQVVVVNEVYKQLISNTQHGNLYDTTGWEFQADQFVTRLGGGRHLATGLNKIMRAGFDPATYWGTPSWLLLQVFISMVVINITYPIVFVLFLLHATFGVHPDLSDYDKPKDRLHRIALELRGHLRVNNLSKERTIELLADIDKVTYMLNDMETRIPWLTQLMVVVWNPFRRQTKEREYQKLLEELANNPLTVTAARFKTADYS